MDTEYPYPSVCVCAMSGHYFITFFCVYIMFQTIYKYQAVLLKRRFKETCFEFKFIGLNEEFGI